jgi:hypothetical protein
MHTVSSTGIIAALASDHDETRDGILLLPACRPIHLDRQQENHSWWPAIRLQRNHLRSLIAADAHSSRKDPAVKSATAATIRFYARICKYLLVSRRQHSDFTMLARNFSLAWSAW